MMTTCPICGTRRVVFWPEHWVFKRGETYYCSENCMMVDQTKDMKLIRMIAHVRAQKGSNAKMARMKKDGTPAKKPGPKKRIEMPEAKKAEVVETPETSVTIEAKKVGVMGARPEEMLEYRIVGIEGQFGVFTYSGKHNEVTWETPDGEAVGLSPTEWRIFAKQMPRVIEVLIAEGSK